MSYFVGCYDGHLLGGLGCYLVTTDDMTWYDALTRCSDMGGHLVSIESNAELQVVTGKLNTHAVTVYTK